MHSQHYWVIFHSFVVGQFFKNFFFNSSLDNDLKPKLAEDTYMSYKNTRVKVLSLILYKNTKVKVCSPDGNTDYFDIVAGVLQGNALASYLFIIYLDYMLRTSIDLMNKNSFKLAKESNRRCLAQTIMDMDYSVSSKDTHPSQNPTT